MAIVYGGSEIIRLSTWIRCPANISPWNCPQPSLWLQSDVICTSFGELNNNDSDQCSLTVALYSQW